jgi:hypothetical protein
MATLDSVWGRMFVRVESTPANSADVKRRSSTPLRAFANEDILFYVKRIDNSGVVRLADPGARARALKMAGSVFGAAVLLIFVLLPSAYGLMAGYRIQSLRQESERLQASRASLELRESQLLSPERMEQLAREQQFVDPAPQKVVYLEDKQGLAMNQ